jgi:hypothetical protein
VKVTIAGADVSRYYNGDQFGRTSVQLSAFDLEVGLGTVVIPEIAGTDAFVTGRQCMVEQGTTVLVDGFLASDDRGRLETEPTKPRREWTMSLEDANAITSNIRAIDWTRSSETCTARILARISADGFSVDTTWVQSTSATLPAKKYKTGDIWSELATDAIERTGWTLFVHDKAAGGRCFHFHSLTTGHACGLSITDVMGAWDNVTSFVPINPRRIRDPADLRSDIILEDQNGRTAHVTDSTSIAAHDADGRRHQEYVQVDADSQADLDLQAARMLLDRKDDITTYECTIGPLDETALGSIRVGDMMTVTSQVFGLTASSQRIANMTLTPLGPTLWTATLELSRPVRHGNKIPGMDGGRDGGGTGGGGNSDPALGDQHCDDCPPYTPIVDTTVHDLVLPLNAADSTPLTSGGWSAVIQTTQTGTTLLSWSGSITPERDAFYIKQFCGVGCCNYPSGSPTFTEQIMALTYGVGTNYNTATVHIVARGTGSASHTQSAKMVIRKGNWGSGSPTATGTGLITIPIPLDSDGLTDTAGTDVVRDFSFSFANGIAQLIYMVDTSGVMPGAQADGYDDCVVTGVTEKNVPVIPEPDQEYSILLGAVNTPDLLNSTITFQRFLPPTSGQVLPSEHAAQGDGTTTTFTAAHPYMPGSLSVTVNSVDWTNEITSSNPATGSFTLSHAPKPDSDIVVTYRAA